MNEAQRDLLIKARDSLRAAHLLANEGLHGFSASRAYYSMFYVAEALLEGEGLSFSRHSAVIAAFGRHFAKTGRLPVEFHRYLREAAESREAGDYAIKQSVSAERSAEHIRQAEEFLKAAEQLLGGQ